MKFNYRDYYDPINSSFYITDYIDQDSENKIVAVLWQEINNVMNDLKNGIIWRDFDKQCPKSVTFEMRYPNGKHGDIDMFIATKYGKVQQIQPIVYKVTMKTKYKDEIEILISFYYFYRSMNALRLTRTDDYKGLIFLQKYNNPYILTELCHCLEKCIGVFKPETQEIRDTLKIHWNRLKKERNQYYKQVIQSGKSTSKWKAEQQVFAIVSHYYRDAMYQYQTEWLGRLSLDVYIPKLNVAIEYQGIQHFEDIGIFGDFETQKERDERKAILCRDHEVKLIYWNYYEEISDDVFLEKIKPYVKHSK